eukprot:scaffold278531_cov35-Tisochrysis_lutea.AAC.1
MRASIKKTEGPQIEKMAIACLTSPIVLGVGLQPRARVSSISSSVPHDVVAIHELESMAHVAAATMTEHSGKETLSKRPDIDAHTSRSRRRMNANVYVYVDCFIKNQYSHEAFPSVSSTAAALSTWLGAFRSRNRSAWDISSGLGAAAGETCFRHQMLVRREGAERRARLERCGVR